MFALHLVARDRLGKATASSPLSSLLRTSYAKPGQCSQPCVSFHRLARLRDFASLRTWHPQGCRTSQRRRKLSAGPWEALHECSTGCQAPAPLLALKRPLQACPQRPAKGRLHSADQELMRTRLFATAFVPGRAFYSRPDEAPHSCDGLS